MTTKYARIGSISSGTMRPEDLIPEYLYTLKQLDRKRYVAIADEYRAVIDEGEPDPEQADYCLQALEDALQEFAPPFCYFGAHEGDGADYGFWVSVESVQDGVADGTILKVEAGDEWPDPLPAGTEWVLEVNDHGNMELYDSKGQSIWGIV